MSQTIGTVLIDVQADTQKLVTGFDKAERTVANATKNMKTAITGLAAAYLSFEGVNAFTGMIKGSIDAADSLSEVAEKLALTSSQLSELQYVSGFAGVSIGQLDAAMSAMIRRIGNFKNDGTGAAVKAMEELGISVDYARENFTDTHTTFNLLIDKLRTVEDATLRTKIAQDLFSKSAAGVVRITNMSANEFKTLAQEGKKAGAIISDEFAQQAGEVNDQLDKLNQSISGLSNSLATELAPIIIDSAEALEKNLPHIIDTIKEITHLSIILGSTALAFKTYNSITKVAIASNIALGGSYNMLNTKILLATASTKLFSKVLKASPFAIATGAVYLLSESFIDASERADSFKFSIKEANSELSLLPFKTRLMDVTSQLAEMDKRFRGYSDNQKLMYKGAYDLLYREQRQLEKNIALIEDKNKKKSESNNNTTKTSATNIKYNIVSEDDFDSAIAQFEELHKAYEDNPIELSTSQWQTYYETLGDYETAWQLKRAQIIEQYGYENAAKLLEIEKASYLNKHNDTSASDILIKQNEGYIKLLDSQLELSDSALSWSANLEGVASTIQNIAKSTLQLGTIEKKSEKERLKSQNEFYELTKDISKDSQEYKNAEINLTKRITAINEASIQSQMIGYGSLAGAMSQMFEEGSKEAASFQMIESGLAVVTGVRAILSQGSGDPYTAFARMAAMAASVASLLSSANVAFGGGGSTTVSSDSFSAQSENTGTGTVLGDSSKKSESIANSLDILEEYARPEFQLLSEMSNSLKSIDQKIGGVSSLLIQNGGFAFGDGYIKPNDEISGLGVDIVDFYERTSGKLIANTVGRLDPLTMAIDGLVANLVGSIFSGIFGKTSVSQDLMDYGIYFNNALLTVAIEQLSGLSYQTIATTISKKSWFKSSSSTSIATYFSGLDEEVGRQFSLILSNLYDTTIMAGDALDTASTNIESSLSNFIVNIGKISTKGKSGEQIQEQISNVFSKIGDDIATTAFPELTPFQDIGEGLYETMIRVATGMEVAEYYIGRLGNSFEDIKYTDIENKQGEVSLEVLAQSITKLDESIYGVDNGVVQMVETFKGTAEELYTTYNAFENIRDMLSIVGKEAKYLTSSMLLGAGSISELEDAIGDYFSSVFNEQQQLTFQTSQMQKEFDKINVVMPTSIEGFKQLIDSIDISTSDGQELLGRIVILSKDYASLIDDTKEMFYSQIQNALDLQKLSVEVFSNAVNAVQTMSNKFTELEDSIEKTITNLLTNSDGANAQDELIISFWEKRAVIDEYLAKDGDLTDAESAKFSSLVSELNSLSSSIQTAQIGDNTEITNSLISELQNLQDEINIDNEILRVKVLDSGGNETDVASVGVITALQQTLAGTTSDPLSILSFKNGGSDLSAVNEVNFRGSFEAQSALSFANELETLRSNLSYINIDSLDVGNFFSELYSLDFNAFENMIEFFNTIGAIDNNQVVINGNTITLPSYDIGSSYIPYDQVAQIHQGEMILDRDFSSKLRKYGIPTNSEFSGAQEIVKVLEETKQIIISQANEIKKLRKLTEDAA